ADLRRHLSDQPLQGVHNRSLKERFSKWRRRRPHALKLGSIFLLLAGALVLAGFYVKRQLNHSMAALDDGRMYATNNRFAEAEGALRQGLALAAGLPGSRSLVQDLNAELSRVERGRLVQNLGAVVDDIRFRYGGDLSSPAELSTLEANCRSLWAKRD